MKKAFVEFKTRQGTVFINKESVDFVVLDKQDRDVKQIKVASGGIWITMDFKVTDDEGKQLYDDVLTEINEIVKNKPYSY